MNETSVKCKEKLESALKTIGWSLRNAGCGHYFLTSPGDKETNMMLFTTTIRVEYRSKHSNCAGIYFDLKYCDILVNEKYVCIRAKDNKNIFINLYTRELA